MQNASHFKVFNLNDKPQFLRESDQRVTFYLGIPSRLARNSLFLLFLTIAQIERVTIAQIERVNVCTVFSEC